MIPPKYQELFDSQPKRMSEEEISRLEEALQQMALYRALGRIFVQPWWTFEEAYVELMRVLKAYGYKNTKVD